MRTLLATFLLGSWLSGGAHAADPGTGAPAPIRIGFVCPFTGGSQDFGNAARLGAELAVKEINEVGGYAGRPFELVERDDRSNPDEGRKIAEELVIQRKADFTIGYCNSGVAMKSIEVYQEHKHLLLIPVATGTGLTAKYPAASSYIFRISVRDEVQVAFLVEDIVTRRGLTKVAVLADKTGYGEGGLKDVERFLAAKGLKPVYVGRFDLGVTSLSAQLQEAKAAGAQALIGYTVGPEQAVIAAARAETHFNGPQFGPWTLSFASVWDKAGPAAEGTLMAQTIIRDLTHERRASFLARLHRLTGDKPVGSLMAAAQTYDAVNLMLRALFQAKGNTDGGALKQALENLERPYAGVVTTYANSFSAQDHDAVTSNMVYLGAWHRGEIQYAYPDDARRAAVIQRKDH